MSNVINLGLFRVISVKAVLNKDREIVGYNYTFKQNKGIIVEFFYSEPVYKLLDRVEISLREDEEKAYRVTSSKYIHSICGDYYSYELQYITCYKGYERNHAKFIFKKDEKEVNYYDLFRSFRKGYSFDIN